MAGYIFLFNDIKALHKAVESGVYSTIFNTEPNINRGWLTQHEGTFADYSTMKEGDDVYFFIERKIYGIGKMINVGPDCKYFNFVGADIPKSFLSKDIQNSLLWSDLREKYARQRMICTFKPAPQFFKEGVDMDDVLTSDPAAFKVIRALWKLSFIKMDDIESQALRNSILKFNESELNEAGKSFHYDNRAHEEIKNKITNLHQFSVDTFLNSCADGHVLKHEMAIELGLLYGLSRKELDVFGAWDYISHQVIASPFKPIDYMDKMDIFGYRYITNHTPTISKYLVIEVKKSIAKQDDLVQLMKYVDWIRGEYCHGDYSMISSYLVASDFDDGVLENKELLARRQYVIGTKPPKSKLWTELRLVKYKYLSEKLNFDLVNP
ncbi:MAG: hypothetical protein PHW63_10000 [Alphaproteobacteria bacterium]|nr:hypothetical protein [Alphaproteobacteria bacterium]